jgi:hypothetical protein
MSSALGPDADAHLSNTTYMQHVEWYSGEVMKARSHDAATD